MRRPRVGALAIIILLAGCAHDSRGSRAVTGEPPVTPGAAAATEPGPAAESQVAPQPAASSAPATAPESPAANVSAPAAGPIAPVAPSTSSPSRPETPKSRASTQGTVPKSAAVSPLPATAAAAAAALPPSKTATPPPLDLKGLEQRLRDTRAIGLFTKLSLKNQVDDLLAQFKAFHQGQSGLTLGQLRQKYELLLMKVVTLLQDGDPALASAVSSSREALWTVLTDPQKFAAIGYST